MKNKLRDFYGWPQKFNLQACGIYIYTLILILGILVPHIGEAADIHIENNPRTHKYILDRQIYVGKNDTLRILPGTNIEVSKNGSIYAEGIVFVGVEDVTSQQASIASTTGSVEASTSTEGQLFVGIVSASTQPMFQINGGQMIVINVHFSGEKLLQSYNNAEIAVTGLTANSGSLVNGVESISPFISVFNNSTLEISHSTIENSRYRRDIFEVFASSSIILSYATIYSEHAQNILSIYQRSRGYVDMSSVYACDRWFMVYQDSSIDGSVNPPVCSSEVQQVFLNSTSNIRFNNEICCSSVFFIPGIQGSRLYKKQLFENQLWEPNRKLDVEKLFLSRSGSSSDPSIYTRDVIRKLNVPSALFNISIYDSFIDMLEQLKTKQTIKGFLAWAYDWRMAPATIVDQKMIDSIIMLARTSHNGKVVIVAHSYGGLVAKELMYQLNTRHLSHLIQQVVLVAVPETGAPQAIFSLIHGYVESIGLNLFIQPATLLQFGINMPALYHLLPTQYFASNIATTFKLEGSALDSSFNINASIQNLLSIPDTLIGWIRGNISQSLDNIVVPNITGKKSSIPKTLPAMFGSMLIASTSNKGVLASAGSYASQSHQRDTGLVSKFKIWSIVGFGIQTMNGFEYKLAPCVIAPCKNFGLFTGLPIYTNKGDGTVVFDSPKNRIGSLLPIDLAKANKQDKTNIKHADILESKHIQAVIRQLLVLGEYTTVSGSIYTGGEVGTTSIIASEVGSALHQFIVNGAVTGGIKRMIGTTTFQSKLVSNGDIMNTIEQIPNTSIAQMGERTIFSSLDMPDSLEITSTGIQKISLSFDNLSINNSGISGTEGVPNFQVVSTSSLGYSVKGIPVIAGSVITVDVSALSSSVHETNSVVAQVDYEDDGVIDKVVSIVPVLQSSSAPSTTAASSTTTSSTTAVQAPIKIIPAIPTRLMVNMSSLSDTLENAKHVADLTDTYSYRRLYLRHIAKWEGVLTKARGRIGLSENYLKAYQSSQSVPFVSARESKQRDLHIFGVEHLNFTEKRDLLNAYFELQSDIQNIIRFDRSYAVYLEKPGILKVVRRNDILKRQKDLSRLFLAFTELETHMLEFLQEHGTIIPERLQRP